MTPAIQRLFEKGLACCHENRPKVEFLEELGKLDPDLAMRAQELRSKLDHHTELCEMGLQLIQSMKES